MLGRESRSVVGWHGLVPSDNGLAQAGHDFGMLLGQVLGLAPVFLHVVKKWVGAIILAEQFPFSGANGQIG